MSRENGHRSGRHSARSTPLRTNHNQTENGVDKTRSNRDIKERGYYSELATINPDSNFQINQQAPIAHDDVLREAFRMSNTARGNLVN